MPATTYLKNKIVDHQLGKAAFTMPTVYVGLSSTTPNPAGTGITEPTAPNNGGYARVATSGATWTSAASGASSNTLAVPFVTASTDWGNGTTIVPMTHGLLFDAPTDGNLLGYSALTVSKSILNGDAASLPTGAITVTLT